MNNMIQKLINAGGKEWRSADGSKHRVYFNNLEEIFNKKYEFDYTQYKTGAISSASINFSTLSNSKAQSLLMALKAGVLYYDVKDESFYYTRLDNSAVKNLGDELIEIIKSL